MLYKVVGPYIFLAIVVLLYVCIVDEKVLTEQGKLIGRIAVVNICIVWPIAFIITKYLKK